MRNSSSAKRLKVFLICGAAWGVWAGTGHAAAPGVPSSFVGTLTLVGTDVVHKDGTETPDPNYGSSPKGLMMIDAEGHYSAQIFKAIRPQFASGDKLKGTPAEYRAAADGSSTHFGTISVDEAKHIITFHIQNASFPNWEGQNQTRAYTFQNGTLRYSVPPRPNGDTPVTIWRKID
jgi:hypothetical protein